MIKKEEKKKALLTIAQAARELGYSWPTIYRWVREEGAPHTTCYTGLRSYKAINLVEFRAWLKARQETQPVRKR